MSLISAVMSMPDAAAHLQAVGPVATLGPDWLDASNMINGFIERFGDAAIVGIAAVIFIETGLLFPILPGDSLLFTAGALVAQGSLQINLAILCVLMFTAAFLGDQTAYWIGRKMGPRLFSRPDGRIFKKKYIEQTSQYFDKYGGRTIVIARFVPIVRTYAAVSAGAARMHYRTFITFNLIGAVLWGVGVTALGYVLGNISFVKNNIEVLLVLIVFISVIPMIVEVLRARSKAKKAAAVEVVDTGAVDEAYVPVVGLAAANADQNGAARLDGDGAAGLNGDSGLGGTTGLGGTSGLGETSGLGGASLNGVTGLGGATQTQQWAAPTSAPIPGAAPPGVPGDVHDALKWTYDQHEAVPVPQWAPVAAHTQPADMSAAQWTPARPEDIAPQVAYMPATGVAPSLAGPTPFATEAPGAAADTATPERWVPLGGTAAAPATASPAASAPPHTPALGAPALGAPAPGAPSPDLGAESGRWAPAKPPAIPGSLAQPSAGPASAEAAQRWAPVTPDPVEAPEPVTTHAPAVAPAPLQAAPLQTAPASNDGQPDDAFSVRLRPANLSPGYLAANPGAANPGAANPAATAQTAAAKTATSQTAAVAAQEAKAGRPEPSDADTTLVMPRSVFPPPSFAPRQSRASRAAMRPPSEPVVVTGRVPDPQGQAPASNPVRKATDASA